MPEQNEAQILDEIGELTTALYEANHQRSVVDYHWLAEEVYRLGYRKQIVGKWIYQEYSMGHYVGKCSLCDAEADMTKFCPNCGAYMKGE